MNSELQSLPHSTIDLSSEARNRIDKAETEPPVPQDPPRDLDHEQARLAYTIIQSLLAHTRVVSDLIAVMAQALDEDTQKALTQTPNWAAYLESRRLLERTRADVEKFAEVLKKLDEE